MTGDRDRWGVEVSELVGMPPSVHFPPKSSNQGDR
jgi:hypothetical protein